MEQESVSALHPQCGLSSETPSDDAWGCLSPLSCMCLRRACVLRGRGFCICTEPVGFQVLKGSLVSVLAVHGLPLHRSVLHGGRHLPAGCPHPTPFPWAMGWAYGV